MIIALEKIRENNLPLVGNKALGLARMKHIGLNVPAGFCVMITAFQEHLESNKLSDKIESALDQLNTASPKERKSILLELRQAIISAPLAGNFRSEVDNHYRTFGNNRVAVRSSATDRA